MSDVPEIVLEIFDSTVDYVMGMQIHSSIKAINILNSNINMISGNFTDNGDSSQLHGGAIYIQNSIVSIQNSTFVNNTANDGGAIDLTCSSIAN